MALSAACTSFDFDPAYSCSAHAVRAEVTVSAFAPLKYFGSGDFFPASMQ